ncbi:MAG: serine hydrolase domain-containing protein, partial [Sphingomonas sp.]
MRIRLMIGALALAGAALMPVQGSGQVATSEAQQRQVGAEILFWSQAQRDANFPAMEKLFPGNTIKAPAHARALPAGAPLSIPAADVDAFMSSMNVAGLIVLQNGKVRLERYARGLTEQGRWTSFSVAKSFTSTLVGAALKDGYIKSVDDPVTRYIPELAGSGYDGVTVAQLLTMTSGVKWNEDYTDPKSDVARMFLEPVPAGVDPTVYFMRKLPRDTAPGTKWVYK